MDILISSNLERLLSVLGGSELCADLMAKLKTAGKYKAPDELMAKIRDNFSGYCLSEEDTHTEIRTTYENENYLIYPHTAVGLGCAKKYRAESGDMTSIVLASTASPYKFAPAVADAIGLEYSDDIFALLNDLSDKTATTVPAPLAGTKDLTVHFTETVSPAEMPDVVFRV